MADSIASTIKERSPWAHMQLRERSEKMEPCHKNHNLQLVPVMVDDQDQTTAWTSQPLLTHLRTNVPLFQALVSCMCHTFEYACREKRVEAREILKLMEIVPTLPSRIRSQSKRLSLRKIKNLFSITELAD